MATPVYLPQTHSISFDQCVTQSAWHDTKRNDELLRRDLKTRKIAVGAAGMGGRAVALKHRTRVVFKERIHAQLARRLNRRALHHLRHARECFGPRG